MLSSEKVRNLGVFVSVGMILNILLMILLIVIISRNEYAVSLVKEKTADLKKQRDLLRAAEKEAKIGHWSYNIKTQEIFWSRQTYRIHEANPDEFTPEIDTAIEFYNENDSHILTDALEKTIETKEPFKIQVRIKTLKGDQIDVVSSGRVELNEKGEVTSLFGTFQDISEIINVQNRLLESEEHYKLATEGANVGLWDWDVISNSVYFNEQWYTMLGYEAYELPETFETFEELVHPEDLKGALETLNAHMDGNMKKYKKAVRMKHKEGQWIWIMTSGQVMERDDLGKATRVSGIHLDVSDRVRNETELIKANTELEEFAYRTSHDLRSPLGSSVGLLKVVTEAIEADNKTMALESASLIRHSMKKLLALIEDLLIVAETRNAEEEDQKIDVTNEIDKAINNLQNMDGFENIVIEKSLKHKKQITTKKMRFSLVLENLISNAVKYHDPKKKKSFIKISTKEKDDKLILEIEDNGLGIPKDMHDKLFVMFKRFHPKVAYGSGLGLYMIKKSGDIIGGQIEFIDTGKGSIFRVSMPLKVRTKQ